MKMFNGVGLVLMSLIVGFSADLIAGSHGGHKVHWGYEGDIGPDKWGGISEEYALCGEGKSQSPIDIAEAGNVVVDSGGIKFHYKNTPLAIINNGHTIQVNYKFDSYIKIGAKEYKLLQFHFHSPSENMVEGEHYSIEAHLVHKNDNDQLAVVGVFIKDGKENPFIQTLWDNIPSEVNKENVIAEISVNAADLLPDDGSYYHFKGSLTTPPCSEAVNWNVLKTPVEASKEQIEKFVSLIGHNARPVQPLFNRAVIELNTGRIELAP